MAIKLNSLSSWKALKNKEVISFVGSDKQERRVKVSFNAETPSTVYLTAGSAKPEYLAALPAGVEDLEFYASGDFQLVVAPSGGGSVFFRTSETERTHTVIDNPKVFTKLAGRRSRNPELEAMMYRAQANMERRFASLADEQERNFNRLLEAERAARETNNAGVPPPANTQTVPAQSATGTQSIETAAGTAASEPAGGADGSATN